MTEILEDQVSYASQPLPRTNSNLSERVRLFEYFNSLDEIKEHIILHMRSKSYNSDRCSHQAQETSRPWFSKLNQTGSVLSTQPSLTSKFKPKKRKRGNLTLKTEEHDSTIVSAISIDAIERDKEVGASSRFATRYNLFSKIFSFGFASTDKEDTTNDIPVDAIEKINSSDTMKNHSLRFFGSYKGDQKKQKVLDEIEIFSSANDEIKTENLDFVSKFNKVIKDDAVANANFSPIQNFKKDLDNKSKVPRSSTAFSRIFLTKSPEIANNVDIVPRFPCKISFNSLLDLYNQSSTESAQLENRIFSPKTHRPKLKDVPSIDTLEEIAEENNTLSKFLDKNPKDRSTNSACPPQTQLVDIDLDTKIDNRKFSSRSHFSLSKFFTSKSNTVSASSAPDNELCTASVCSNFSETINAIKDILPKRFKPSFLNEMRRSSLLHVRSASPNNSPVPMTNPEDLSLATSAFASLKSSPIPDIVTATSFLDIIKDDDEEFILDPFVATEALQEIQNQTTGNSDEKKFSISRLQQLFGSSKIDFFTNSNISISQMETFDGEINGSIKSD